MKLSRLALHHAFKRFQSIHRHEDRRPLDSFRNPNTYACRTEDYKEQVARQAWTILEPDTWSRREVGRGRILRRVIAAIEQPGNNLLQWDARFGPHRRVHHRLHEALERRPVVREMEKLFFDLYAERHTGPNQFEHLAWFCGKRYELIAYLFFIANRHRFLPIRTTWFDRAFAELGLSLRTARQCSWDNYMEYLSAMAAVQDGLRHEGILEPSLLDAHSFCWILATYGRSRERRMPPRILSRIRMFSGVIVTPPAEDEDDGDLASRPVRDGRVDMQAVAAERAAIGRLAEEVALEEERRRLWQLRRPDLADRVTMVSDRPGLGYDIESFERNGDPRRIEVKNTGAKGEFRLSANEWRRSRVLANYWFYLVTSCDAKRPKIVQLSASRLTRDHLLPVEYVVRLRSNR